MNRKFNNAILTIAPMALGVIVMQIVIFITPEDDIFTDLLISSVVAFPVLIVYNKVLHMIFADKNSIEYKISHCKIRRKNGLNYCAVCKDSYVCISKE